MSKIKLTPPFIERKIMPIRGHKVMLDRDLAELYGVPTKILKRQVRRNASRFPSDFMFELTKAETENWRRQFGTSNSSEKMGVRHAPFAFTEHGILMLSSVLNSSRAIQVNIEIMRTFTRLKQAVASNKEIFQKLSELEKKVACHDADIANVFEVIRQLMTVPEKPKRRIGFVQH
jgi:phage regulator Rha-like protein